jgi:hypothetical protein
LDIVHRRDPANVARLLSALLAIDAYYWEHLGRRLVPEEQALLQPGRHLLDTDLGHLDVLGTIGSGSDCEDSTSQTLAITIGADLHVRVLSLDALIRSKRETGRPKDLAALPLLEATLGGDSADEQPSDTCP